jgi:hypothetical protein
MAVLDVLMMGGERSGKTAVDLLIEIPHGATRTEDFTTLADRLVSPLPAGLVDFFHVNTDAGAFELAAAITRAFVAAEPKRRVVILRCRIPRTFIDCNRRIDASLEDFKAGKVTPGIMPWITDPADLGLLRGLYEDYVEQVRGWVADLAPGGAMLLLHTYAPRTVDVEVDLKIVESLRRAYQPDVEPTWPLRPEIDVIGRDVEGTSLTPAPFLDALRDEMARLGLTVADSATYPIHPSTLAWEHVTRLPGRAVCVEVRRDLLADPWDPFAEMRIGREKAERLAGAFVAALRHGMLRA